MKKSILIVLHIAFWVILLLSNAITPLVSRYISMEEFGKASRIGIYLAPLCFYLAYFGVMFLIKRKKYIYYFIISILVILFILYIISPGIFTFSLVVISRLIFWLIFGIIFKYFTDWFNKREINSRLSKKNLESELALLQTQINPHFLFNTIHNIDTLISKNPDKASKSLIKLSDIMRYMLNDAKNTKVLLEKEIEYLKNFFDLQKLRINNPESIKWKVEGNPENISIAPMLFIPFLENAFKHGEIDDNNNISALLNIKRNSLEFTSVNTIIKEEVEKDNIPGIGLETVKRRLELIYPNKHRLKITKENDIFEVNLSIELYGS